MGLHEHERGGPGADGRLGAGHRLTVPHMPQHKALLVGASEYDEPRIADLPFVRDDLQRLHDVLVERGFHSAEIVESKRGITPNTVNGRIRSFLREAGRGDTLLILLSGHGQHFEGKDYLIPEDATFDIGVFAEACIEIGWERELEESQAAHVVFLIDACREGIDRDTMATEGVQPWSRRKVAAALRRKVAYVYACTAPQLALFVRESDTVRAGSDPGTEPGESFSIFSRAVADTVTSDTHALRLHEFARRVQQRVEGLHRAYGKTRAVQRVTVRADTEPGGGDFPLLPGPDRHTAAHPWIRSVERHPIWERTPDGPARQVLQQTCAALAGRLATTYEEAARSLHDDPWHDSELAQRAHARLGFLTGRFADGATLSPSEAALAVLLPLVEQTFWAQEAAQRISLLATAEDGDPGTDRGRFRNFAQSFPRLKRRLLTLRHEKAAGDSVRYIRWWLFHRWLIQQPELYAPETLKALLAEVPPLPDQPSWVTDALSGERLMRLLKDHRTAPFSVRRPAGRAVPAAGPHHPDEHDVIAASTGDEHEVRGTLVSALVKAAYAMAVDPVDLPEIVVEHIGIYDSVDLTALRTTVRSSDWRTSGAGRSLNAVCTHPAVQIALREHADRVDALLREINRAGAPALLPLAPLPPYADGSRVRLDGNTPDQLSDGIRFQLAEDRVQELLMGEQLYGDRELAVRELYQNALDALRYRDCRTQYLQRTGRPTDPFEGSISFAQGVDSDKRPYLECRDNGIGMSITELSSVFSQGGARFVDLPEYVEEQVAWSELPDPKIKLHPNSRFGIGVLSYFMLADEIVVRTCRMGRDGRPGRVLRVTIAGPGNLFRVEDLGEGEREDIGTVVRLRLSRQGRDVSCVDSLQRVLWVAPYRVTAVHGAREHAWEPGELSSTALEIALERKARTRRLEERPVCLASDSPDLWWIDDAAILLADGLLTETEKLSFQRPRPPYGVIINLHGEHAPVLTVDRKKVRSFDPAHVLALMIAAAPSLACPGLALPTVDWLTQVSSHTLLFADHLAERARCADLEWRIGHVSLPFGTVGFFLPDAALLPLVTGHYPVSHPPAAARYFYDMPAPVLRWRLRALFRTVPGSSVSVPGTEVSDELCARPSDLLLLARTPRFHRWDTMYRDWQAQADYQHPVKNLGYLFRWRDPAEPLRPSDIFDMSGEVERPPAEVADRMTALGFPVESLAGCAEATCNDLSLLRRAGDLTDWLTPGSTLSTVQVCVSSALRGCSPREAAQRLRELGFTVPAEPPARDWSDEEQIIIWSLWEAHATSPSPEEVVDVSHAQLTSVAHTTDTSLHCLMEFLSELGFRLPVGAAARTELTEEDRSLLNCYGRTLWVDQEVSIPYVAVLARSLHQPAHAVAERLRDLGYAVAPVPGADQLPSPAQLSLLKQRPILDTTRPMGLHDVRSSASDAGVSLSEAISQFTSWGYTSSITAETASRLGESDPQFFSMLSYIPDADGYGPIPPSVIHALGANATQLDGFGYDIVPPSEAWLRERRLEEALFRRLAHPDWANTPVSTVPDDPPLSLVTLAVVALQTRKNLREVALKAANLGMRHEIEDWFPPTATAVDA
jgi:hypothetical protein